MYITLTITYVFVLLNRQNSIPLTAINTLIQMPYQWLFNTIIEISVIGCIIETLGNVIRTLKIPPTITVSVCYYNYKLAG